MSSPDRAVLRGERVVVRRIQPDDAPAYRAAVIRSAERIGRWNPVNPDGFGAMLADQGATLLSWLVVDGETGELAGKINLANVMFGRTMSASVAYDAYDPWAGTGRMGEGLALLVGHALRPAHRGGLGLHRVEAVVQPGNVRSAGMLRRLGFRLEGRAERFIQVPRPGEGDDWRDHDRYAVTAEEWPATPYAAPRRERLVVLVNGLPGQARAPLARALAGELGLPLLPVDVAGAALGSLLAASPVGAVVEGAWSAADRDRARAALEGARHEASAVVEVWCDEPGARGATGPAPLGLGPLLRAESTGRPEPADVVRLALDVRALASGLGE